MRKDKGKKEKKEEVEEVVKEEEVKEAAEVVEEKDPLVVLEEEVNLWKNNYYKAYADIENMKRRLLTEQENHRKYSMQELMSKMLSVLDNFERALLIDDNASEEVKSYQKGFTMIYSQLVSILESEGVTVIETNNVQFDPNVHQAVVQVQDETLESGMVVEELQKGYKLNDRVIRPSLVKVNE